MSKKNRNRNVQLANTRNRQHTTTLEQQHLLASAYQGPIPPPEILERFNEICPGAADRILAMAEMNNQFRIDITNKNLGNEYSFKKRGQFFGLIVAIVALVTSCVLGYFNQTVAASIIGSTTLVSLVAVFITGKVFTKPNG